MNDHLKQISLPGVIPDPATDVNNCVVPVPPDGPVPLYCRKNVEMFNAKGAELIN
jgi:hypothetical protein